MNLEELNDILKGEILNYKYIKINSFSIDTRTIKKNDAFIAIKGKYKDGHSYINSELKCGCLIVEEDINSNLPTIKVKSTYDVLYKIGNYLIKKYNIPVIAITGSNGKTTLKELLYKILINKYNVLKNKGNDNNILGVFKTLCKLNNRYDLILLELGMNHFNEISKMSKMILPNTAVITNIGSAHIGLLNGKKNIYKAKMEIVDGLKGSLIVNGDDYYLKRTDSYKCGLKLNNDLIAYNIDIINNKLVFKVYLDKEYSVVFNIPSITYVNIILEAISVSMDYKININDILNSIKNYKPFNQRLEIIKKDNYTIIDDSYNASYESVKCGLEIINSMDSFKIIILGDMLELGKYSKKYHKKINNLLKNINDKVVLTVGKYTKNINSIHFNTNDELIKYLKKINLNNSYIYIKGSRAMNLDRVVKYLMQ